MWTTIISWLSNLKNMVMAALCLCLLASVGYASIRDFQMKAKERIIAEQKTELKTKAEIIDRQNARISDMSTNIQNIKTARNAIAKVQEANKKLKEQIAQLSEEKDNGKETVVYRDMFDFFVSGGV